ncbi:heparinase II/III family protein [Planctomycetota bacterium]
MKKTTLFVILVFTFFSQAASAQAYRNLLGGTYAYETIQSCLLPGHDWVPFPKYADREAWDQLPPEVKAVQIAQGEKYLGYQWQWISATMYLEFVRSGNRKIAGDPSNENLSVLQALVLAELIEGKGRFLDDIINGVFFYSEQTYWGLSAHLYLQREPEGFPDENDITIDLGAGKVGANLAWTWYFLHEAFDEVHPLISKRLKSEIKKKILTPYYTRVDMWWMGYTREMQNNWNPWVNYNVLNCIMLIEEDPITRAINVQKNMRSVDQLLNYYKEDGGCEEGPSYWSHAAGKVFDYLELLSRISGDRFNIYDQALIKNMGRYIYRAYISDEYFMNFADASAKIHPDPWRIYRFGQRIDDPLMSGFGALLHQRNHSEPAALNGKIERTLDLLFNGSSIEKATPIEPLPKEVHFPQTEVVALREAEGSKTGFYLAAKGGYNDESHNHNDVGSCLVYYDAEPILIDVGVATYTRQTFSDERYSIWTMQSGFHNVPTINGQDQPYGKQYKAKHTKLDSSERKTSYEVDMTTAYSESAKVGSWIRTYTLNRGKSIEIVDHYDLSERSGETLLNFMTSVKPEMNKAGGINLGSVQFIYDPAQFTASFETIKITDGRLSRAWKDQVYRMRLKLIRSEHKGEIRVRLISNR